MDADLSPAGGSAARQRRYRGLSLWLDGLEEPLSPRQPLPGDTDADIAVVGAGYTGLWTAYYLLRADPHLRVVLLEREIAGYGASGRNGGWCSALFAAPLGRLARGFGLEAATALRKAMEQTVDEVGGAAAKEGIDCRYAKGGTVVLARNAAQLRRAIEEVAEARRLGVGEDDLALLGADEARRRCAASDVLGGTFTPHCAAIDPARLVRGLATAVEARGAVVHELTEVIGVEPGVVRTDRGRVRAEVVVVATEGYSAGLPGLHRSIVPIYSLMVATEPLGPERWEAIGLAGRETFSDGRHLLVYGQRTADGRLAFGGRGAPYHFASAVRPELDSDEKVHARIVAALGELFGRELFGGGPGSVAVTHRWGGPIGIHRDWFPSVTLDRRSGLARAGGYVGDGVGTSNLAGRTLAELVLDRDSELSRLCWVGHRSRRFEPEPLRWVGANALLALTASADRAEARSGRPARRAALVGAVTGH